MKKLILVIALSSLSSSIFARDCTIDLKVKTTGAKTHYTLNGDTISKKVMEKLAPQCKFNVKVMSASELKAMKIKRLKKQLAKLSK